MSDWNEDQDTLIREASDFFKNDRFAMKVTGIEILEVRDRYCRCGLTLTEDHRNAVGQVMGGAIFTLADFAFAVAANFRQPGVTVTSVNHITYLTGAKGDHIYACAVPVRDGRNICNYKVTITDDNNTPVAVVDTTGAHI